MESKNPEDAARPQRSAARNRPGNSVNRLRVCRLLLLTTLCAGGCASTPDRMEQTAARLGLSAGQVTGQGYRLRVYRNAVRQAKGRLHIYLDGDGTPWLTPTRIGRDPTPRNHLVLRLLAMDPGAALYLSRPCYNGRAGAPGCGPWMWTFGRYSETVVAAMESALRELVVREGASELVLIGYSGGGVLAWLLAQRVPEVRALITVAANLDIDRWADLHGYSRLGGSLNPAQGPPMRPGVRQWHLVGNADKNVPPYIVRALDAKLGGQAEVLVLDSNHNCCWHDYWPGILGELHTSHLDFAASAASATRGRGTP